MWFRARLESTNFVLPPYQQYHMGLDGLPVLWPSDACTPTCGTTTSARSSRLLTPRRRTEPWQWTPSRPTPAPCWPTRTPGWPSSSCWSSWGSSCCCWSSSSSRGSGSPLRSSRRPASESERGLFCGEFSSNPPLTCFVDLLLLLLAMFFLFSFHGF